MRGKIRIALLSGTVFILGASALRAAEPTAPPPDAMKPEARAPADAAPPAPVTDRIAPAVAAPAAPGPGTVDVRCTVPPIEVRLTGAPPATDAGARKPSRSGGGGFNWSKIGHDLLLTVIFSLVGLMIALFGYFVYQWIVPFDLRKELEIDQNTSLGIVCGAIILGLCIIVAAAIHSPG